MDRKTILAFVLIALVLVLYPLYMQWTGLNKKTTQPSVVGEDTTRVAVPQPVAQPADTVVTGKAAVAAPQKTPTLVPASSEPERELKVETPLYTALFTSQGGNLKSLVLKKYVDFKKEVIDLVGDGQNGHNLDVVFPDSNFSLSAISFVSDKPDLSLSQKGEKKEIAFRFSSAGLSVTKTYTFYADRYGFDLSLSVNGNSALLGRKYYLAWASGMPATEKKDLKNLSEDLSYFATYASIGGEMLENKGPKDTSLMEFSRSGKTIWVASRSKYFVASLITPDSSGSGFYTSGKNAYDVVNGNQVLVGKRLSIRLEKEVPNQPSFTHKFLIHIGPLDYWALGKYDIGLQDMVNLGWVGFKPFAIGILWFFVNLHKIIPNYGVVIIIFTMLMKIIFFPLSRKMTKTSLLMAEMAPKINKLKEKYKEDKQKLNQEIFKLYREHKINPLGGCLPLLIQIPIFWGLFVLLKSTIEMRQAPFVGWIKDLSIADPYYILPVIMAVAMFFQQKMTMKDPRQKMLVYLMPAMFFFFFYGFAAGLTLYWTVYNILSVGEQYLIRSQMQPIAHQEPAAP
jgi:YidC/Oxa1 family membrane protein insertase